jgi:thioredoxin 1
MATDVTDANFQQEVLEGSKSTPVLVDFWAEWCGPCHAVSPVLDKIAEERSGQLKLVKLNIDENQQTAQTYGVMSIPTMILFKDGEPAAATIGARPKGDIEKQLGLDPVTA